MSSQPIKKQNIIFILAIGCAPLLLNGFYNQLIIDSPITYWTVEIITWVCLPLSLYFIGIKKGIFTNQDIGFHSNIRGARSHAQLIWLSLFVPLLLLVADKILHAIARYIFPINYGYINFQYGNLVPDSGPLRWIILLYFMLTASFIEGVYFRGLMKRLFQNPNLKSLNYVLISSLLFSALHWENGIQNIFVTLGLGMLFSGMYLAIDNLWPLVASHALLDYVWFS